ncbi:MAG: glycoside hydrolase family 5 protein [Caldilineaceae bacterium]
MRNLLLILSVIVPLFTACVPIQSQPAKQAPIPTADIFAVNQQLGRGVNLGNALESPNYEGEWGLRLIESYFTLIADAGFDHVRVPIRWSTHAEADAPFQIDKTFFERIDWVIAQAKANRLFVVINMHHYEEMMSDPIGHTERFLALWRQIAERYKDEPASVIFELLNEPNGTLNANEWNKILPQAIAAVRESNPTRAIIVGPVQWNSIGYLYTLQLPKDPNLIVTFHYYEPFQFTHQGAEWVNGANAWMGITWSGSEAEQAAIISAFDTAAKWAAKNKRPLYMGEFGAYSKADMASRARWTAFLAKSAQERNISFSYWEFGAGFGVYDRTANRWNEELLQALLQ